MSSTSPTTFTRAVVVLTANLAAAEHRIRGAIRGAVACGDPSHNTSDGKEAAP